MCELIFNLYLDKSMKKVCQEAPVVIFEDKKKKKNMNRISKTLQNEVQISDVYRSILQKARTPTH